LIFLYISHKILIFSKIAIYKSLRPCIIKVIKNKGVFLREDALTFYIIGNFVPYDINPSGGSHCGEVEDVAKATPQAENPANQDSIS